MAIETVGLTHSLLSSGGSTGDQYKAIVATSSASSRGYATVAVRGGKLTGILMGNSTQAVYQKYQYAGIAKVAAGDSSGMDTAITEGIKVVASSKGQAVPSTAINLSLIGIALTNLATGSTGIIDVQLTIGAASTA